MTSPILFEEKPAANGKRIGVATLNAPKALNALSLDMVVLLAEKLSTWQKDNTIACVLLQGAGDKAFCAGGDIRKLYQSILENPQGPNAYAEEFFSTEYRLDYAIHRYSKPLICWGHGIVMGGGLGLMSGAGYRVVTETTHIAMPEIGIGLYPDVGASWFLARMPGHTGLFAGLTGCKLNAADALFVGLADRFISSDKKTTFDQALLAADWRSPSDSHPKDANHKIVSALLKELEIQSLKTQPSAGQGMPESKLRHYYDQINELCDFADLAAIGNAVAQHNSDDKWFISAQKKLQAGCPVTAYLVQEQIKRAKYLSLAEVFRMEFIMSMQCCFHPDFAEGVRALLIDKDNKARWRYESIGGVPSAYVDAHFESQWSAHPLADL